MQPTKVQANSPLQASTAFTAAILSIKDDPWYKELNKPEQKAIEAAAKTALLTAGKKESVSIKDIKSILESGGKWTDHNIDLIASDLAGKMPGIYQFQNLAQLGYQSWQWQTVNDSLVDEECEGLDQKVFPITTQFQPAHVNCRCFAKPYGDPEVEMTPEQKALNKVVEFVPNPEQSNKLIELIKKKLQEEKWEDGGETWLQTLIDNVKEEFQDIFKSETLEKFQVLWSEQDQELLDFFNGIPVGSDVAEIGQIIYDLLVSGLMPTTNVDLVAYHGLVVPDGTAEQLGPGTSISSPAPISFSFEPQNAYSNGITDLIVVETLIPKNTPVLSTELNELILPPGTWLTIMSAPFNNGMADYYTAVALAKYGA